MLKTARDGARLTISVAIVAVILLTVLSMLVSQSFGRFLIWDADGNTNSGPVIDAALSSHGYQGDYTSDISTYLDDLSDYCAIFICLGVYDQTYVLTPGPTVDSLASFLDRGGRIYMEGGDTWAFDPPTTLHAYFNTRGLDDGLGDLDTILGHAFFEGGRWPYSGDNDFIDRLDTLGAAVVIFSNNSPAYNCGIIYDDGPGSYMTIAVSFKFNGLPYIEYNPMADYIMELFGCPPGTGVEEAATVESKPKPFELTQNIPNPFSTVSVIRYSLPLAARATLQIYDISGRLVETLVNETQQPGIHQVRWTRKANPSGVYFYSLRAGDFVETRKMVAVD